MKKCKYLVFGDGQVAGFILDIFKDTVVSSADVTKPDEIERDIKKYRPGFCINTAAMTSLEWCELNKLKAFEINTLGALNVWSACQKYNLFLCHFSSGCIYSSKNVSQIYDEDDTPNPECFYSWTKVWSENLLGLEERLLIIRPRVVISSKVDSRNTLSKWLTFSHFITEQNSVTILEDFIPVLKRMIDKKIHGTFNAVNEGTISPFEAGVLLKKFIDKELKLNKTTLDKVNENLIARRVSTILSSKKLKKEGFSLPNVHKSFPKIVKMYKRNLESNEAKLALEKVKGETFYRYTLKSKNPSTFTN